MPINSHHPSYDSFLSKWTKCRDCHDGEEKVKSKGVEYLPLLSSMLSSADEKYKAYKERAMFYAATARTVEGLAGMVLRKLPIIKVPAKMEPLLEDITGTGINIYSFINGIVSELVLTGRYSIHVDRGDGIGNMPYFVGSITERAINWSYDSNGDLEFLVIEEVVDKRDPDDKYVIIEEINYRELYMEEGVYKVRLWKPADKKDEWVAEETIPTKRGTPLDKIPQTFVNPLGTTGDMVNPPLLGMVNVNLSHYRTYADLEHGRHFTGLPTPYVTGVDSDEFGGVKAPTSEGAAPAPSFLIGSEVILSLPRDATAGYMEFTGAGLVYLENAAKEKAELMAILGARLIQNQKMVAEAAETARINKSGDSSIMVSIASSAEAAIKDSLQMIADWEGIAGEIEVEINKDMLDVTIDPNLVNSLMASWQNGGISHDTFLYNLKQGELIANDVTIEEEKDKIETEGPKLGDENLDLDK